MSNSKLDISTAIAAVKSAYYGRDVRQAFVDALNAVEAAVNNIDLSQVITAHAISHNSIFRGADLSAKYSLSKLCEMVGNGDFSDIFVGDYFSISGVISVPKENTASDGATSIVTTSVEYSTNLRVAGINTYLATGATLFDKPHIVMIPDDILFKTPMNLTASTSGGYKSSFFHTDIVPALKTHFSEKFGSHLLARHVSISNAVQSGASAGFEWLDEYLTLPTEIELFGCSIWSSSPYDIGSGNRQLPLFRLAPEYITKQRQHYWLSAVASAKEFCYVDADGECGRIAADSTSNIGIRPILTIG
ncbi:hypothetical protein [uncultured Ruminococcus sp.]|uniref:hypothetical protein n=1 Tax=uncultured Ruminococcus sp. TaxID=165186 RepID=UPI00261239B3|nr:hypothetical protein [uncultured Ruminococcus sp.]